MATVIKVDGTIEELKNPTLEDFQKAVGGYIEALNIGSGKYLVVNEEGLMMNLPLNKSATAIWRNGPIVGNAVICTKKEL